MAARGNQTRVGQRHGARPIDRPRYDSRVSAPPAPVPRRPGEQQTVPFSRPADDNPTRPKAADLNRAFLRVKGEVRLTALAIWRGVVGVYNSDDMTFAASIAYYSLLSLFPFLLLVFSILDLLVKDELTIRWFVGNLTFSISIWIVGAYIEVKMRKEG